MKESRFSGLGTLRTVSGLIKSWHWHNLLRIGSRSFSFSTLFWISNIWRRKVIKTLKTACNKKFSPKAVCLEFRDWENKLWGKICMSSYFQCFFSISSSTRLLKLKCKSRTKYEISISQSQPKPICKPTNR